MYGAAHALSLHPGGDRAPLLYHKKPQAMPVANRYCAFSAFSHPRNGGVGKDHSGVAAREIVRIAKEESAV